MKTDVLFEFDENNDYIKESEQMLTELEAYHGSPYDFDEFDVKYIGSGQGAQSHGWGLYFALYADTSQGYADSYGYKGGVHSYTYDGKTYPEGSIWYTVIDKLKKDSKEKVKDYLKTLLSYTDWIKENPDYKEKIMDIINNISSINQRNINNAKSNIGQFFTVRIPELEYYLDEERAFITQTEFVKKALIKIQKEHPEIRLHLGKSVNDITITGRTIYDHLRNHFHSKKEASLFLNSYGIVGISYTGGSDSACVVVFNTKDIKIIKKLVQSDDKDAVQLPDEEKMKENPELIRTIKNPSEEMQMKAVKYKPSLIKFIENPTEKVQMYVLEQNIRNIEYIKNPTEKVKKYVLDKDYSIAAEYMQLDEKDIIRIIKSGDLCQDIRYNRVIDILKKYDQKIFYMALKRYPELLSSCNENDLIDYAKNNKNDIYNNSYFISSLRVYIDDVPDDIRDILLNIDFNNSREYTHKYDDIYLNNFKKNLLKNRDVPYISFSPDFLNSVDGQKFIDKLEKIIIEAYKNHNIHINMSDNVYSHLSPKALSILFKNRSGTILAILASKNNYDDMIKVLSDNFDNIKNDKDLLNRVYNFIFSLQNDMKEKILKNETIKKLFDSDSLTKKINYLRTTKDYKQFIKNHKSLLNQKIINGIIMKKPETAKYLTLDDNMQKKLVKANPYNIKWINNPSKEVIDIAKKEIPDVELYIRK